MYSPYSISDSNAFSDFRLWLASLVWSLWSVGAPIRRALKKVLNHEATVISAKSEIIKCSMYPCSLDCWLCQFQSVSWDASERRCIKSRRLTQEGQVSKRKQSRKLTSGMLATETLTTTPERIITILTQMMEKDTESHWLMSTCNWKWSSLHQCSCSGSLLW